MNNGTKAPDVKQIFDTWVAGYTAGDTKKVMSVFDRDLRYIKPCQPEQTFESLSAWYEFDFRRQDYPRQSWTYEIESVDPGSDLAVVVSQWTAVTNFGGFSANVQRLRSIDVLRLGSEGWKIVRTINDPLSCNAPVKTVTVPVQSRKPGRLLKRRR
jgi:hypothetical protein